jgi:hypothetical protein
MLGKLSEADLDTLTKALAPLERLAAGEPVGPADCEAGAEQA